jgi:hypothetical protein
MNGNMKAYHSEFNHLTAIAGWSHCALSGQMIRLRERWWPAQDISSIVDHER